MRPLLLTALCSLACPAFADNVVPPGSNPTAATAHATLANAPIPADLPDFYRQVAARRGIPGETLYRHALERAGWVNEHKLLVPWPWTVRVNGRLYRFRSRQEMFAWLLDQRGKAGIVFGIDERPLRQQSREVLWAEMEVAAMLDRAALRLSLPLQQVAAAPRGGKAVSAPQPAKSLPAPVSGELSALIARVSRETGVDALLLHAVVVQESAYKTSARSPKGAMGLMQLMPATARELGLSPAQYYDPYANLFGGATYLKRQIDTFGALEPALAAYNAGPNAVRKYRGVPPYRETRDYVSRISSHYRTLLAQHRPAQAKKSVVPTSGKAPLSAQKTVAMQTQGKAQRPAQAKSAAPQQAQAIPRRVALRQETPVLLLNPARGYD